MDVKKDTFMIVGKTFKTPFSRGILAHHLARVGLPLHEGHLLASEISVRLLSEGTREISTDDFREVVKKAIRDKFGQKHADRYDLLERWQSAHKSLIIMISGAPGVGKRRVSQDVGFRLDIYRNFETDLIRHISQKVISQDLAPELYHSSHNAYKALRPIYSALFDRVIVGFEEQAKYLKAGVDAMFNRAKLERASIIIRGEHLVPQVLGKEIRDRPDILFVTLHLADPETHLKRILSERQLGKSAAKVFTRIRKIHDYLVEGAEVMGLPLLEATSISKTTEALFDMCIEQINQLMRQSKD